MSKAERERRWAERVNAALAIEAQGDPRRAYQLLVPQASSGDPRAAFEVGRLIDTGRARTRLSAERRLKAASDWLIRAGKRDEPRAKLHLALMFEQGRPGLAADRARAQCFRQSANMEVSFATCVRGWRRI
jgi:TPR repeat protein